MKPVFSLICCLLSVMVTSAADLTASVTPSAPGKKEGKISLLVSGGFAPYTFSWTGPSGYASSSMSPDFLDPGTYCVTVTDQYCGTASLCVTVEEKPTGIGVFTAELFSVYPNPFGNCLCINPGRQLKGTAHLTLSDNTGRLVARLDTEAAGGLCWNLGAPLAAGIYILRAVFPDGSTGQTRVQALGK